MTEPDLSYIHPTLRPMAVPIADLTFDPKNARKHDSRNLEAIKASLKKFGMRQPIVVQSKAGEMVVRAGNGRLAVAKQLGWTHLPATIYDESDDEAIAYALADNRTAELAEWDFENLAGALTDLQDNFDLNGFGWSDDELSFLLSDDAPMLTAPPSPQPGISNAVGSLADQQQAPASTGHSSVTAPREFDVEIAEEVELGSCPNCDTELPLTAFRVEQ